MRVLSWVLKLIVTLTPLDLLKWEPKHLVLLQATNDHYLLPISNFDVKKMVDIPSDFSLETGQKAIALKKAGLDEAQDAVAVIFEQSSGPPI